ncbi:hypothetical protein [Blastochloris tepida]|uniref:Uncharacterized protein n=1 Tax=Blastochloris tepida TaxID=2233851 RepID=A0A348FZ17_9HYPH|nr:hypothetical protein [Blastochloris tepida]BBF92550.1 hypothetical protein BLTE_12350 [Blastochloris tepida]
MNRLPPRPDFEKIEAAAPASADQRTAVLALIGNIVFSWSNNESLLIYVMMLLLDSDETTAAIVFSTLNTTRARLDLIERLSRANVTDRALAKELARLMERFNACTRARNEFNHCMYGLDEQGLITHTRSLRLELTRTRLQWGTERPMDETRLQEMTTLLRELRALNRDLWEFLPRLQTGVRTLSSRPSAPAAARP